MGCEMKCDDYDDSNDAMNDERHHAWAVLWVQLVPRAVGHAAFWVWIYRYFEWLMVGTGDLVSDGGATIEIRGERR